MLAEKIWEYDERLDERLEDLENVLQDYLSQWDERIENLDNEVSDIFVTWLEDGTLEKIINHDVLGNKADKSYVDDELEKVNTQLNEKATATITEKILYVDSNLGDDITGVGSEENPFKTIQKAYDEIPTIVVHQYIIQLADGVY